MLGFRRNGNLLGKLIAALLDSAISLVYSLSLERWLSNEQREEDDPERPNINFKPMASLGQDLRSNVIGRSAGGESSLAVMIHLGAESEVPNFDLHLVVEENIAKLDIPMDNSFLMQVLQSTEQLQHVAFGLEFGDPDSAFEEF